MQARGSQKVGVNGVYLEIVRCGQGPPLLVISPSWWPLATWQVRVVDHLCRDFEVILFNHRGVGRSDETEQGYTVDQFAADAAGLADALGYQKVHVFGFAIGGATALTLARDFPEVPLTLTVVGTGLATPASERDVMVHQVQEEIAAHGYERYLRAHVDNDSSAFSPGFYHYNRDVVAALADALWHHHPREEVFLRHVSARASYELAEWVHEIKVPTVIAVGGADHVPRGASTPLGTAHQLAEQIPNATLRLFPGVRHMLPWEAPAELSAILRFFIPASGDKGSPSPCG